MKKILGSYWVVLGLLVIGTATKLKAATASVHISESYFEGKTEYPDGSYLKVTTSWNESGQAVFYSGDKQGMVAGS